MAQELETITEVNNNQEVQSRYGLNSVQSDMFMSRARDLGAINILSGSTSAKSFDGVFTEEIESTGTKESAYNFIAASGNLFVAAAAKDVNENEFTTENARYVDIIAKELSMYKGMNISNFNIDDSAPYMYTDDMGGASNIDGETITKATFRATIIAK